MSLRHAREILSASPVASLIAVELAVGGAICLLSLVLFAHITHEFLDNEATGVDLAICRYVYAHRTPTATGLMLVASTVGGEWFVPVVSLATVALTWRRYRRVAAVFALTLVLGFLLNLAFKGWIERPRPAMAPLIFVNGNSFPSGHAMNALVFYALMAYAAYHLSSRRWQRVAVAAVVAPLVLLIGFSRVYLGAHYPSDVAAGFFAGLWWFLSVLVVERTLSLRRELGPGAAGGRP